MPRARPGALRRPARASGPRRVGAGARPPRRTGAQVANETVARTLKVPRGAMVQSVAPGGAGERAGLLPPRRSLGGVLPGDVVAAVNGTAVAKPGARPAFCATARGAHACAAVPLRGAGGWAVAERAVDGLVSQRMCPACATAQATWPMRWRRATWATQSA